MTRSPAQSRSRTVVPIRPLGDDVSLVEAVKRGDPGATDALYERHGPYVRRVLFRVLGRDAEVREALQEVFVRALSSMKRLDRPERLRSWLASIAALTARDLIRRRARGAWLRFFAPAQVPTATATGSTPELRESSRAVYAILERLPVDERIAFAFRFIEKMSLQEVADTTSVSLATVKRRLMRARSQFAEEARQHRALTEWFEDSRFASRFDEETR